MGLGEGLEGVGVFLFFVFAGFEVPGIAVGGVDVVEVFGGEGVEHGGKGKAKAEMATDNVKSL